MTKPARPVPDCTVHVDAFADYYRHNRTWGIFHVSLDDGNWHCEAAEASTPEEKALAEIHAQLSPSQRRKLASLAEVQAMRALYKRNTSRAT